MSNIKTAKKGEFLVKEGEKVQSLVLVQQGGVSVCLQRNKKTIEIFPLGSSQVLGELGLSSGGAHPFSVYATTETKYMEVPLEAAKAQIEGSSQFLKFLIKSLLDRLKLLMNEVKSSKMEKDSAPCPEDQVAKVFGAIYHSFRHKGQQLDEKIPQRISLDWTLLKQYTQRIFGESPRRIEQALTLLRKKKMAELEMGKAIDDPEGPDELQRIHMLDLEAVEAFFEFYQYHYFKASKPEILKVDETCVLLLDHFLKLAEGLEPDRFGVILMDYNKIVEAFKEDLEIVLHNGHFTLLESRGVFAKRQNRQDGSVAFSFELKEWKNTLKIWHILREIDRWNERGFVDLKEDDPKPKKKSGGPSCPQCSSEVIAQAKFCQECGFKLEFPQSA